MYYIRKLTQHKAKSYLVCITNSFDFVSKSPWIFFVGKMFVLISVLASLFNVLFLDFMPLTVALNKFVRSAMLEYDSYPLDACKLLVYLKSEIIITRSFRYLSRPSCRLATFLTEYAIRCITFFAVSAASVLLTCDLIPSNHQKYRVLLIRLSWLESSINIANV